MPSAPQPFLARFDDADWSRLLDALDPQMHEVDRVATRIWFRFFPLALADALATTDDMPRLRRLLRLDGDARLSNQIDTSHWFLYGHRYWPHVKHGIGVHHATLAARGAHGLDLVVQDVVRPLSDGGHLDHSVLLGITAVGLMTLRQVGIDAFTATRPSTAESLDPRSPDHVVRARQADTRRSLWARLLGRSPRHEARFDERRPDGAFAVVPPQHLTTAGAADRRPYGAARGFSQDGPIPAQCRTGSCGTCWVGVLGGAERLSAVDDIEARRLLECGYLDAVEAHPFIRLACMARASGNVTFVVPPWNGFLTAGLRRLLPAQASPANTASPAPETVPRPAPARVHPLSAPELKAMMEAGLPFELVDVRTSLEWETARIDGARLLDRAYHDHLMGLPPDTPLVFQCHHGVRSQAAAEYFRDKGFVRLYNLQGGIDAWSRLVDPSVPLY